MHHATCPTCSTAFASKRPKTFCSMRCYIASPECQARLHANMASGRAKGKGPARAGDEIACKHCGNTFYRKPRGSQSFCTRTCYRAWLAERFDANVATTELIPLPQGYDEFLSQDHLPCLVKGCAWRGQNLSQHIVQTHGELARRFKKRAGFNISTGLVAPELSKRLRQWNRAAEGAPAVKPRSHGTGAMSLEAREHHDKAMALRMAARREQQ